MFTILCVSLLDNNNKIVPYFDQQDFEIEMKTRKKESFYDLFVGLVFMISVMWYENKGSSKVYFYYLI